jgi:hypothetical protein
MNQGHTRTRDEALGWLVFEAGPEGAEMLQRARSELRASSRPARGLLAKSLGVSRSLRIAELAVDYSRALLKTIDPCDWIYYERQVPDLKVARASAMEIGELYENVEGAKKLQELVRKPVENRANIEQVIHGLLDMAVEIEGPAGPADFQKGIMFNARFAREDGVSHWENLVLNADSPRMRCAALATFIVAAMNVGQFARALRAMSINATVLDRDFGAILIGNSLALSVFVDDRALAEHCMSKLADLLPNKAVVTQVTAQIENVLDRARKDNVVSSALIRDVERYMSKLR